MYWAPLGTAVGALVLLLCGYSIFYFSSALYHPLALIFGYNYFSGRFTVAFRYFFRSSKTYIKIKFSTAKDTNC